MPKKSLSDRIKAFAEDPREKTVKILQGAINSVRGYSYDIQKNGELALLRQMAKITPRVVFDVGANTGKWSAAARDSLGSACEIYAFELSHSTFEILRKNLQGKNVICHNMGLGDRAGELDYKDYGEGSEVNTLLTNATYHDHKIKPTLRRATIATGDEFCATRNLNQIDLLKVDVEGAEHLVLRGFSTMLTLKRIRVVQFEYGYTNGDAHFLMRDFYQLFASFGYQVGRLEPRRVRIQPWNYKMNDFRSGPNFVAIQETDTEMKSLLGQFS